MTNKKIDNIKNVFICNWVFHLMISIWYILKYHSKINSKIIIFNDNNFISESILNQLIHEKFDILKIENKTLIEKYIKPCFLNFQEYKNIKKTYLFINYPFWNQIILNKFKKSKKVLLEEWIASYRKWNENDSFFNKILSIFNLKITNIWWNHTSIDILFCRFPAEIQNSLCLPVKEENILKPYLDNIIYIKSLFNVETYSYTNDDLIFLSNSFVFENKKEYIEKISEILNNKKYKNKNIYIKLHPRENYDLFNNLKIEYQFIPKHIPVELIWNNTNILTFYSSSILNLDSNITLIKFKNNEDYNTLKNIANKYVKKIHL